MSLFCSVLLMRAGCRSPRAGGVGRRQLKYHFKTLGIDLCKLYSFLHETISTSSLLTALADISTTAPSRSRAMRTTRQVFNEILVSSSCSTFRYERRASHTLFSSYSICHFSFLSPWKVKKIFIISIFFSLLLPSGKLKFLIGARMRREIVGEENIEKMWQGSTSFSSSTYFHSSLEDAQFSFTRFSLSIHLL